MDKRQYGLACLNFCMCVINKIKHQIYGLLEGGQGKEESQICADKYNKNTQINDQASPLNNGNQIMNEIDGLCILQSGIFEKYEQMIMQLIGKQQQELASFKTNQQQVYKENQYSQLQQSVDYMHDLEQQQSQLKIQSNIKPMKHLQQEVQDDNKKSKTNSQLVLDLLSQLMRNHNQKKAPNSYKKQQSETKNDRELSQLINSIESQPELLLLQFSNNALIIKLNTQQYQLQTQTQLQQQQVQQQSQSQIETTNKYLWAQRQLQFLIKEKQLNKKLSQTLQQIDELKNLIQLKQTVITQKNAQIIQLNKHLNQVNIIKNRQHKVSMLKHKIQKDSLIKQLCLQRQRDQLQMFIQKENINANINLESIINSQQKGSLYMMTNGHSTNKPDSKLLFIKSPNTSKVYYQSEITQ